jgi:hypothetical protein
VVVGSSLEPAGARILRDHARDLDRDLFDHPAEHRGGLRVGGVAKQHPPGVATLLHEREECLEAGGQALHSRLHLDTDECTGHALAELPRVPRDQVRVELLLGGEVLVDQGLRDARLACDVVDRGGVVAVLRERAEGCVEDAGPALLGCQAASCGCCHGYPQGARKPCVIHVTVN